MMKTFNEAIEQLKVAIKQDYINDEKCRLNSKLLGKLLILANKDD